MLSAPASSAQPASPPSFGAVCAATPSAAILTTGDVKSGSRSIYRYVAPSGGSAGSTTLLGVLEESTEGAALYKGSLYGIVKGTATFIQAASDGTVLNSATVPGLPSNKPLYSGAVDPDAGFFYTKPARSSRLFVVDLNDLAAPANGLPLLTVDGQRFLFSSEDIAFNGGFVYGYDDALAQGVRIDTGTGQVVLFDVTGLPAQAYKSAWFRSAGVLALSDGTNVYTVDVRNPVWQVTSTVTLSPALDDLSADGTACPIAPPPTFDAVCSVNPNAAIIMRAQSDAVLNRILYRYIPPTSGTSNSATTLGIINAPVNAVGLYQGFLYGIGRFNSALYQISNDGTILSTTPTGLPTPAAGANAGLSFLSGTVDVDAGLFYVHQRDDSKIYVLDLNNIAAGVVAVRTIRLSSQGNGVRTNIVDFALFDGFLYGYDERAGRGVRINPQTGIMERFNVTGLPNSSYGSAWINPQRQLVLNTNNQVYEVDITGSTWTTRRSLTVNGFSGSVQDAAACPVFAPPSPKSFNCAANPDASFITGSKAKLGSRDLYRYTADVDEGEAQLELLGEIDAPLNAFGLYADTLYGYHRTTGTLYQVNADGAIADSVVVPGLPTGNGRSYIAGTVDPATGTHYTFARYFAKAYAVDLDNVAAGAAKLTFRDAPSGNKVVLDFGDFAYSGGFLYGYHHTDPTNPTSPPSAGFKVNVATGAVTFIPVPGLPAQLYPASWIGLEGSRMFLYKTAAEVYEINISSDTQWTIEQTFTGLQALNAQRDGATCGGISPAARSAAPASLEAELGTAQVPAAVSLGNAYPNPVRGRAQLAFGMPQDGRATVSVYDVMGRQVAVLFDGEAEAGWTETTFEASALAAGTYIVRLRAPTGAATSKLVVID